MAERRTYSEAELNEMYPSRAAQARAGAVSTAAGAYTGSAAADKRKAGPWYKNTSGWDNPALGIVLGLGTMGLSTAPGIAGKIGTMLGGKMAGGGALQNIARYAPAALTAAGQATGSPGLQKAGMFAGLASPWVGPGSVGQKIFATAPAATQMAGIATGNKGLYDVGKWGSYAMPFINPRSQTREKIQSGVRLGEDIATRMGVNPLAAHGVGRLLQSAITPDEVREEREGSQVYNTENV
jgi:hypothetical protein